MQHGHKMNSTTKTSTSPGRDTQTLSVPHGFFFLNVKLDEGKGEKHLWKTMAIKLTLHKDAFVGAKKYVSSLLPC